MSGEITFESDETAYWCSHNAIFNTFKRALVATMILASGSTIACCIPFELTREWSGLRTKVTKTRNTPQTQRLPQPLIDPFQLPFDAQRNLRDYNSDFRWKAQRKSREKLISFCLCFWFFDSCAKGMKNVNVTTQRLLRWLRLWINKHVNGTVGRFVLDFSNGLLL